MAVITCFAEVFTIVPPLYPTTEPEEKSCCYARRKADRLKAITGNYPLLITDPVARTSLEYHQHSVRDMNIYRFA